MPILTLKHCLFCYKEDDDNVDNGSKGDTSSSVGEGSSKEKSDNNQEKKKDSINKRINPRSEICRRFCTLAARYFDLDLSSLNPAKTLNSKKMISCSRACKKCAEILKSFCDIYANWQYLQMQLDHRAGEILEIMQNADKVDSINATFKNELARKLNNYQMTMDDINEFRDHFKDSVSYSRANNCYPELRLERSDDGKDLRESDGNQQRNEPVVTVSKYKRRRETPSTISKVKSRTDSSGLTGVPETLPQPPRQRRRWSRSRSSSTDSSSSDDSFIYPVVVEKPNTAIETSLPDDKVESQVTNPSELGSSDNRLKEEDKPVADYNPVQCSNTNIDSNRNDLSNACSNLNLQSEPSICTNNSSKTTTANNVISEQELPIIDEDPSGLEILKLAGKKFGNDDSIIVIENSPSKHFLYKPSKEAKIKYICPFPTCGKKFNTVTRFIVHREATGHCWYGVVHISNK